MKQRFISIWQAFALRYKEYGNNVAFELLNEIVEPNSDRWNKLSKMAVSKIREIDPNRIIIIGGNNYNSVTTLKELEQIDDENVAYTFHFYEPHIFTHQKAVWESAMKGLNFTISYPAKQEEHSQYLKMSQEFQKAYSFDVPTGKEYLRSLLQPALDFIKERDISLYCGEYGVIQEVPKDSSLRWHEDLCDLLMEYGIGRAVWNYKLMGFPMVDKNSRVVNERLIEIISRK